MAVYDELETYESKKEFVLKYYPSVGEDDNNAQGMVNNINESIKDLRRTIRLMNGIEDPEEDEGE